ncbi:MAG: hypothetical protein IJI58_04570 [Bacilli bacterium]|nr:hypothetical protein [Bacilli bacterium]
MYLANSSSYISGLFNLSSSVSKTIGPSYIQADCFEKKDYKKKFIEMYEIPKEEFNIEKYDNSLEQLLIDLLGNNKDLIEGLLHWLHIESGDVKEIYTVPEDSNVMNYIGSEYNGYGPFFFCEDLYFIETDRMIICLLIGNDE